MCVYVCVCVCVCVSEGRGGALHHDSSLYRRRGRTQMVVVVDTQGYIERWGVKRGRERVCERERERGGVVFLCRSVSTLGLCVCE